jgi:hypothetical protein
MPFMPAVNLSQWSGALPTWSCFVRFFSILFCFRRACSAGSSFGFHNVCCPNASFCSGSVYASIRWSRPPNMVIYAMSKSATATSGLI